MLVNAGLCPYYIHFGFSYSLSLCSGACDSNRHNGWDREGARYGVLIKGGEALEITHRVDTIVFDKTGTITQGKPEVTDVITVGNISKEYILQIASSAEKGSEHPLGEAIVRKAQENNLKFEIIDNFKAIPGHGIKVNIKDKEILIGSAKLMGKEGISLGNLNEQSDKLATEERHNVYCHRQKYSRYYCGGGCCKRG